MLYVLSFQEQKLRLEFQLTLMYQDKKCLNFIEENAKQKRKQT